MDLVTTDWESYYDNEYSLSRMSPLAYVMDDRFEAISVSLKVNDKPTGTWFGSDIPKGLATIDWKNAFVIGHNLLGFDAYVMAYRYGINPAMWGCTLAMARAVLSKSLPRLGLGYLVEEFGLGVKDQTILLQTKGRRLKDFTAEERQRMGRYNADDTDQCYGVFRVLRKYFSAKELWHIDKAIRMRTEPRFELDFGLLQTAASIERDRKHKALLDLFRTLKDISSEEEKAELSMLTADEKVEHIKKELASSAKFSSLLERLGVEVPLKPSPTNPEKEIPALSKTDQAMQDLQEHDDPIVAAAAHCRLDVKSTLLETRIEKFIEAGTAAKGFLPIPIRPNGADTTGRDSGEEYNPQNLPRIDKKKPKVTDALRKSLRAPKGKKVIVADQSGIELRVNHFLWKVPSSMALYQADPEKADLYRSFAARSLFRIPEEQIDKNQRQLGKVAQLGLGFGAGAPTFRRVARTMGGIVIPLSRDEETPKDVVTAEETVFAWRGDYSEIVQGWKACGIGVIDVARQVENGIDPWGLVHTTPEGFMLPSRRIIRYPNLRQEDDGEWPDGRAKKSWFYGVGRAKARITGPKACENIVQALARDSIFDVAFEFFKLTGLRPALEVHDELIYVVDEDKAEELLRLLQSLLRRPPGWWPELVTWSEGDIADTYGDAK